MSGGEAMSERWRCLKVGCNPKLDQKTAQDHREQTGHRVAKWPVRSAEGQRRHEESNRERIIAQASEGRPYGPAYEEDDEEGTWYR